MHKDQSKLLRELMEVEFCVLDLALYLDTHPNDEGALRLHNTFVSKYNELEAMYKLKYGPLTIYDMSKYPWQYIQSPWPWEIDYCGCDN